MYKEREVQSMNYPNKKKNQKQIETDRNEKIQVTADELEKVTGGASFGFYDVEKRKPKDKRPTDRSTGD